MLHSLHLRSTCEGRLQLRLLLRRACEPGLIILIQYYNLFICLCPFTQLSEMQNQVRRLRSTCEKTTKREWKEGKGQLNKRILTKITVRLVFTFIFNTNAKKLAFETPPPHGVFPGHSLLMSVKFKKIPPYRGTYSK